MKPPDRDLSRLANTLEPPSRYATPLRAQLLILLGLLAALVGVLAWGLS